MAVKGAGYGVQMDSNCDSNSNKPQELGHIFEPLCRSFLSSVLGMEIATSQSNGEE